MANILVVTQYFWPEEFRINSVVEELSRKGHSVSVLTGIPNYPSGTIDKDYLKNKDKYGFYHQSKIHRVPMLRRGTSYVSLTLNYLSFFISASILGPFFLRGLKVDAVIVYQLSPATVLTPGYIIARIKNSKYIPWIQDLWPEAVPLLEFRLLKPLSFFIEKFVDFFLKRADYVICQSRSFVVALNKRGVDQKKLKFIPNWAEKFYSETAINFAPQIQRDDSFFTIMFAGNLGVAQDLPNVLKAIDLVFNKNKKVRWMFVGDGRILPWMADEVKALGLDQNVYFLGRFPVETMPNFFSHADAMLISLSDKPIYGRTIPSKLQSYFMAGKPILGMLPGEGAAVLNMSKSGICVDAADYEGLSEAVLTMASLSKKTLTEMSVNSRRFGLDNYSEAKLIVDLEELIN
jgi:colanic acid biosynthesis glycosyl transferase WcaI